MSPVPNGWAMKKNDFPEAKTICNEMCGAVLEVPGRKRALSVQPPIDIIEVARAGYFISVV